VRDAPGRRRDARAFPLGGAHRARATEGVAPAPVAASDDVTSVITVVVVVFTFE
jgi:hypothetical protein